MQREELCSARFQNENAMLGFNSPPCTIHCTKTSKLGMQMEPFTKRYYKWHLHRENFRVQRWLQLLHTKSCGIYGLLSKAIPIRRIISKQFANLSMIKNTEVKKNAVKQFFIHITWFRYCDRPFDRFADSNKQDLRNVLAHLTI